jgi:hypothetical protein
MAIQIARARPWHAFPNFPGVISAALAQMFSRLDNVTITILLAIAA